MVELPLAPCIRGRWGRCSLLDLGGHMRDDCSLGAQEVSPFSFLVGARPCVTFKSWLKRPHKIPELTHQLVHAFPGWIHDQLVVYSVSWLFQALRSYPESRVAAEVQGPFSGKGALKEMHERVEEVFP